MPTVMDERVSDMIKRLEAGATLKEIAEDYGISKQRVQELTNGLYDREKKRTARRESILHMVDLYKAEILEDWLNGKGYREIALELGLPIYYVTLRIKEWRQELDPLDTIRHKSRAISRTRTRFSGEEIVGIIQFVAEQEGHAPSVKDYNRWREQFPLWPSIVTITRAGKRFNDYVREAGFTPNELPVGLGLPTFSDADIFSAIRTVYNIVGHLPTVYEYTFHRPDGAIREAAIRRRFGNWTNALEAFDNYEKTNRKK